MSLVLRNAIDIHVLTANNLSEAQLGGANRHQKALLVTSTAWPPVKCGRQGRAIVVNQVST